MRIEMDKRMMSQDIFLYIIRYRIIVIFIFLWFSGPSIAEQLIVHPGITQEGFRKETVRALFTMRLRRWENGTPVRVFVYPDQHPLHRTFTKETLGVFSHQLRRAWDRRVFSGIGQAPTEVKNEQEMLERVATTPGAVGYVSDSAGGEGVRIIPVD